MDTKQLAKVNYERNLWTKDMLKALVKKTGVEFTIDDYNEITGENLDTIV